MPLSDWPKHYDGRNKRFGEMTPAERLEQTRLAFARLQVKFSDHARQAALAEAIKDWDIRNARTNLDD